jgi:tRNA(Ile)-lysidine synthase
MPSTPPNPEFIQQINAYIANHNLIPAGSRIIVGLSGGPDSLFLLYFLVGLRGEKSLELIAAHLDHEWRENSGQDVLFCNQVCENLGVTFVSAKLSELNSFTQKPLFTAKQNGSKEEYARKARRAFFEQIKREYHADLIALAHHKQDQQETFFIRIARGATATGLTCMRPKTGDYIRPLLETDKADILVYLEQQGITYLQDPSNSSHDFLRNRIRHTVLPALEKADSRFAHNMQRTIAQLQETENFLEKLTQQIFELCTTRDNASLPEKKPKLNLKIFLAQDIFIQQRVLMQLLVTERVPFTPTQKLLQEITRFLKQAGSKSHQLNTLWRITKKQPWAFIEKTISPE